MNNLSDVPAWVVPVLMLHALASRDDRPRHLPVDVQHRCMVEEAFDLAEQFNLEYERRGFA